MGVCVAVWVAVAVGVSVGVGGTAVDVSGGGMPSPITCTVIADGFPTVYPSNSELMDTSIFLEGPGCTVYPAAWTVLSPLRNTNALRLETLESISSKMRTPPSSFIAPSVNGGLIRTVIIRCPPTCTGEGKMPAMQTVGFSGVPAGEQVWLAWALALSEDRIP